MRVDTMSTLEYVAAPPVFLSSGRGAALSASNMFTACRAAGGGASRQANAAVPSSANCMGGADAAGSIMSKMATLTVLNRAKEIVADGLRAESFMDFRRKFRGSALIITLDCGEEIFVDSCKLFRKLPNNHYTARLLRRARSIPDGIDAEGSTVWMEA